MAFPIDTINAKLKQNHKYTACNLFLVLVTATLLNGCGTIVGATINAANKIDQSRDRSRMNSLIGAHLQSIKDLQAKGDPMGDFLWAEANEKGLIDNPIKDKQIIKQMYADAAAKGSVDAQIVLGVKQFYEGGSYRRNDGGTEEEWASQAPVWQDALKKIEQATKKQCWYYSTYIFAPQQKRCLTPVSAARKVWPKFRDGFNYPQDSGLHEYWKQRDDICEASPAFKAARRKCLPFGG